MIARIAGAVLASVHYCHYCGRGWPTVVEKEACVNRCYQERYGK